MSTHRAIAITAPTQINELQVHTPTPDSLGATQVLVETAYTPLIAFDTYMSDFSFSMAEKDYPVVLGMSASGHVKALGSKVEGLKLGDPVRVN